MNAIDLAADILDAYDKRIYKAVLDGSSGIRIEEMARAVAMLTTYTEREALDSLKLELRRFTNSSGALDRAFEARSPGKVECLSGDLARLEIARDAISDVITDLWTDSPVYIRKLDKIDVLGPFDKLIAEGEWCLNKEEGKKCK